VEDKTRVWWRQLSAQHRKILDDEYNLRTPPLLWTSRNLKDYPHQPTVSSKRFDVMHITAECADLKRIGAPGKGDGGKFICGVDQMNMTRDQCVVFSIGSMGNYLFEEAIVEHTTCVVEVFDCTGNYKVPKHLTDRVHFHRVCLGSKDEKIAKRQFLTFQSLLQFTAHRFVTLLKMDIEGYEWDVLPALLTEYESTNTFGLLPFQISFELHLMEAHIVRPRSVGEVVHVASLLYDAGYRIISREDNIQSPKCSEFTVMRFFC